MKKINLISCIFLLVLFSCKNKNSESKPVSNKTEVKLLEKKQDLKIELKDTEEAIFFSIEELEFAVLKINFNVENKSDELVVFDKKSGQKILVLNKYQTLKNEFSDKENQIIYLERSKIIFDVIDSEKSQLFFYNITLGRNFNSMLNINLFNFLKLDNVFEGKTILLNAIEHNDFKLIDWLLDKKVNLDKPNDLGEYPLLVAQNNGNHEVVELLLENGSNPNVLDTEGNNLLLNEFYLHLENLDLVSEGVKEKIIEKSIDRISLYIEKGCDLNLKNQSGANLKELLIEKNLYNKFSKLIK